MKSVHGVIENGQLILKDAMPKEGTYSVIVTFLEDAAELAQLDVAVRLLREDAVTLSRAAEIAGVNVWAFRELLAARGIPLVVDVPEPADMDQAIAQFMAN